MVFYYLSEIVSPAYVIYMGRDKHENEELIRWGWPEDVWFHVDNLSSAHVYLRLHPGESLDDVPEAVIQDCAQLVKANSIQGCKANNVAVVYTAWDNLKKTASMEVGQVGFHRAKLVRRVCVEKRITEVVKRLEKTKREEDAPNFREQREARDAEERAKTKQLEKERKQAEKEEADRKQKEKEENSYDRIFVPSNMTSNKDMAGYDSDDFFN